jgi:membrane protein implicated in regulation of membrane protease activity
MSSIDWPLAILLAVVFVVMSVLRWKYFMSVRKRTKNESPDKRTPG